MAESPSYEVKKIISKLEIDGETQYLIRWKGFSAKFDSWEPKSNLGSCKKVLKAFEEKKKNDSEKKVKEKARKKAQELVKKSKKVKTKSDKSVLKKEKVKGVKPTKNDGLPQSNLSATGEKLKVKKSEIKGKSKSTKGETSEKTKNKLVPKAKTVKKSKSACTDKLEKKVLSVKPKKLEKSSEKKNINSALTLLGNAKYLNKKCLSKIVSGDKSKSEGAKKGVKRKLEQVSSDDEDILYSINDVIDMPSDSDVSNEKGKEKSKNGNRKYLLAAKSKDEKSQDISHVKKRLNLLDSIKKKKKNDIVNPSVSQSLPVLPYFTSVKPLVSQNRPALGGSSLLMDKFYADVPSTFSLTPSIMPVSPSSISYKALLDNLPMQMHPKKNSKKAAVVAESEAERVERRVSVRTTECAFRYKQIVVKKCSKYTQIWLNTSTAMKNAINPQVVHEIVSALNSAKYDDSNLVMLSSIGSMFCSGIDLNFLLTGERRVAVRQMVDAVRDLIKTFITFPKPIIAAVPGPAIGLGMAILPLCDVIYASDKALFYLPYSQLSQTPEGCISFTLPLAVGLAVSNELLFAGRKITAMEAYQLGLVSQVFWPTSVMQEVIPRVQHMAMYSAKAMEATKLLIRSHHRTKLELTNETECNLLLERWSTMDCQRAIETYLSDENNFHL